jgi:hypothetical protein
VSEVIIKLKPLHPAQLQILSEAKRFNVLKCGRRFGKTELTKELAIQPMLDGLPVGYWTPTYKDLHEVWNELKNTLHPIIKSKDEQVKQITLITGGKIDMWSMEDPNSGRGRFYKRAIIDEAEKALHMKDAWEQTIRATLTDLEGDAWIMSTPKFGQTYFKRELFQNEKKFNNWKSWRFTTYDNPHMPKSEVDAARAQLDNLTFRCEYLAEDVDVTNNPFAYAFEENRHVGITPEYDFGYELLLSFDFNVDPITAIAGQMYNDSLYILKEFRLSNSDIYELCDRILATYPDALFMVTGDATGQARSAITKGNLNYYKVIKEKLGIGSRQIKTPSINPAITDSRVLVNSLLQNYNIKIHETECPFLIEDLKYVAMTDENDIDKGKDKHRSHLLDTFRYMCNTFLKHFLHIDTKNKLTLPQPESTGAQRDREQILDELENDDSTRY